MAEHDSLTKADFEALARFRSGLRLYFRFSEREVRRIGLTPQQYQLLLAIKGFPGRDWATMTEIAERLQCSHNSAVGLVDRTEANGLVQRMPHPRDRRSVQVHLTERGEDVIARLVVVHREELGRLGEMLQMPSFGQAEEAVG
jgi:DNA-binding MarR family transcriptional regulator